MKHTVLSVSTAQGFAPGDVITISPASCCMRRARARYWRIARGYFGLGAALGVAVGMLLGAWSVP